MSTLKDSCLEDLIKYYQWRENNFISLFMNKMNYFLDKISKRYFKCNSNSISNLFNSNSIKLIYNNSYSFNNKFLLFFNNHNLLDFSSLLLWIFNNPKDNLQILQEWIKHLTNKTNLFHFNSLIWVLIKMQCPIQILICSNTKITWCLTLKTYN